MRINEPFENNQGLTTLLGGQNHVRTHARDRGLKMINEFSAATFGVKPATTDTQCRRARARRGAVRSFFFFSYFSSLPRPMITTPPPPQLVYKVRSYVLSPCPTDRPRNKQNKTKRSLWASQLSSELP